MSGELRHPSKQQEASSKRGVGEGTTDKQRAVVEPYVEEHLEMETEEAISKSYILFGARATIIIFKQKLKKNYVKQIV